MAVRHRGLTERVSGEPRERRRSVTPARREAVLSPSPTALARPVPLAPVRMPGDDWAYSPCAFDFDPLFEDYDF